MNMRTRTTAAAMMFVATLVFLGGLRVTAAPRSCQEDCDAERGACWAECDSACGDWSTTCTVPCRNSCDDTYWTCSSGAMICGVAYYYECTTAGYWFNYEVLLGWHHVLHEDESASAAARYQPLGRRVSQLRTANNAAVNRPHNGP